MSKIFAPLPLPKSKLAIYRRLSSTAGVRVSPLCLGGMSIGDRWSEGMGSMTREDSFKLLDAYYDLGGNFIDTANFYQDESSEQVIGEWAEKKGIRDQLFIATKFAGAPKYWDDSIPQKILYGGTSLKSMHINIEASLKKLKTTYIDLYYVHFWDWDTSIPELMHGLHALVTSRKVLYLGVSDTPAWIVAQANQYARDHALTPFSVYQGQWSVLDRSFERDIIPMARHEGMALAPFGVLGGGKIRTDAEEEKRRQTGELGRTAFGSWERNENEKKVSKALGVPVAIAYVMHKTRYVFPIIGGRKIEHLQANLEGLEIALTPEHIEFLDSALPFDVGFPHTMIGDGIKPLWLNNPSGHIEYWPPGIDV